VQLHCLEVEVHAKGVLKCMITALGEPCVMMDSLIQRQESFATLSDLDTLEERLILTPTASGKNRFGWTTFVVTERKGTSVTVHIKNGDLTTVNTTRTWLFPASATHPQLVLVSDHLRP